MPKDRNTVIEIIVGVYFASLCLSLIITGLSYWSSWRYLHSKPVAHLDLNLAKVGKFWSHTTGALEPLTANSREQDRDKSLKQILWLGLLGFGSAPGCLLLIIVSLSLRFIARPRLEQKLMQGPLSQKPTLSEEEVRMILQNLIPSLE